MWRGASRFAAPRYPHCPANNVQAAKLVCEYASEREVCSREEVLEVASLALAQAEERDKSARESLMSVLRDEHPPR